MSALRSHIEKWSRGRADDMKQMAARQANEWDLTVGRLETLEANDAEAEHILRAASEQLQVLTVTFGPIHSWTLSGHHLIFRTACRLWGPDQRLFNKPNWSERG